MYRTLKVINFSLMAVATAIGAGFFYEEYQREKLIESYVVPIDVIKKLQVVGVLSVGTLIKNDETMICFLDGYGSAEDLRALNVSQRESLPKSILPSQDVAWYLIFVKNSQYSRIYLLDRFGQSGLDIDHYGCLKREQKILVEKNTRTRERAIFKIIPKF